MGKSYFIDLYLSVAVMCPLGQYSNNQYLVAVLFVCILVWWLGLVVIVEELLQCCIVVCVRRICKKVLCIWAVYCRMGIFPIYVVEMCDEWLRVCYSVDCVVSGTSVQVEYV